MKKILIFLTVSSIIFKNSDATFIPIQSLFFVIALKNHGFFTFGKKRSSITGKPAFFMFCGLCLSLLFLLYSGANVLKANLLYAVDTFSQYLLFYSVINFMVLFGKPQKFLRVILIIVTLFPCLSMLSPKVPSLIFTVVMFVSSVTLFLLSVLYEKEHLRHHLP